MTGRVMLEKRIEVPAQIAKRKFTRQSWFFPLFVDFNALKCYDIVKVWQKDVKVIWMN